VLVVKKDGGDAVSGGLVKLNPAVVVNFGFSNVKGDVFLEPLVAEVSLDF
jgi:hypothetical protein